MFRNCQQWNLIYNMKFLRFFFCETWFFFCETFMIIYKTDIFLQITIWFPSMNLLSVALLGHLAGVSLTEDANKPLFVKVLYLLQLYRKIYVINTGLLVNGCLSIAELITMTLMFNFWMKTRSLYMLRTKTLKL